MVELDDVRVSPLAYIKGIFTTGNHVAIDQWVYCSVELHLGNWIHIAPFVSIIGGSLGKCILGDFSAIAAGGRVICASEDFINSLLCPIIPLKYRSVKSGIVILEDFAAIGTNAVVMPNVVMAEGSVLGAGAVLTHNTEPWMVYMGVPARPVKMRNKELILENAYKLGYE